ncbi:MAG: alpha/beta hydrolase [Oscillospiraceae bacterium]|nr:alpha/beta hydrolase [Oscillospiraceae bacterium]
MKEATALSQQCKKGKALKLTGLFLAGLVTFVTLAFISIMVIYPAIVRSTNRIITPNGIDSMEVIEIDGIYQALYFRGQDTSNPVILMLHGGPGAPDMPQLHNYQFELEGYFTIVRLDQRNTGKTFFLNNPEEVLETLTFERVVSDAHEVTKYIRERLNTEQIIVLGHSWGSILGSALVQQYPQYFSAYISVGQAVNMHESERLGLEAVIEAARANGNSRSIAAAEALRLPQGDFSEDWISYLIEVRALMGRYGYGGNHLQLAWSSMTSPYYTLREKMYYITVDALRNQWSLFEYIFSANFDIRNFGTDYQIPVFYIMGELDRQTSYQLAREFYEEISAPYKAFFSIPNAGHMSMHENTTEYNRILIEEIRPLIMAR